MSCALEDDDLVGGHFHRRFDCECNCVGYDLSRHGVSIAGARRLSINSRQTGSIAEPRAVLEHVATMNLRNPSLETPHSSIR
jgi:hypothetical protein